MSTKKQTKQFAMLQEQKGVALLVHDFGTGNNSTTNSSTTDTDTTNTTTNNNSTITLNGNCRVFVLSIIIWDCIMRLTQKLRYISNIFFLMIRRFN